jgi:hypothetical protein
MDAVFDEPVLIIKAAWGGLTDQSHSMVTFRQAMVAADGIAESSDHVIAVQTAPYWSDKMGEIDLKRAKMRQMGHFLRFKHSRCNSQPQLRNLT